MFFFPSIEGGKQQLVQLEVGHHGALPEPLAELGWHFEGEGFQVGGLDRSDRRRGGRALRGFRHRCGLFGGQGLQIDGWALGHGRILSFTNSHIIAFSLSSVLVFFQSRFHGVPQGGHFLSSHPFRLDLQGGFAMREGFRIDYALVHPGRQDQPQSFERHRRPVVVFQIGPDAGQHEAERLAGLPHQGQAFDQGAQIGGCRVERDQNQVGHRKQISVDRADGRGGIHEQISRSGLAQRPNLVPQFGQGQGRVQRRIEAGFFPLVEPVARGALRVGIREDNRAVPGVFGGSGEVNRDSRFAGTAFLIGHHDGFHENENTIILSFMKDGNGKGVACRRATETVRTPLRFRMIRAFGFLSVHVRAQDGVDPGLVAALAPEPFQQVGIQSQGDGSLRFWKNHLGILPEVFVGRAGVGVAVDARTDVGGAQAV